MGNNNNKTPKGPRLPDWNTLQTLGFYNPDVLPKDEIKKVLRINDEAVHCNRFKWFNLPRGLTGNMIERMLYYRGQIAWVYLPGLDQFTMLPFCLNGDIDFFGRYMDISPLPFNGRGEADIKDIKDARKSKDPQVILLSSIKAHVLYDPIDFEEIKEKPDIITSSAVILSDYTRQLSQIIIPKYRLTEQIIDYESNLIPYMNTALASATGVAGMKVGGQDEQDNVELASAQVQWAALTGRKWIPIDGNVDFQELAAGNIAKAEEFLLAMQSLDNWRLGIHGVENGGLFEKKAHTTDLENSINMGTSGMTLDDALWNRQNFCDIVNSITGFGIWCEPNETSVGMDYDMDGMVAGGSDDQAMMMENNAPAEGGGSDGE